MNRTPSLWAGKFLVRKFGIEFNTIVIFLEQRILNVYLFSSQKLERKLNRDNSEDHKYRSDRTPTKSVIMENLNEVSKSIAHKSLNEMISKFQRNSNLLFSTNVNEKSFSIEWYVNTSKMLIWSIFSPLNRVHMVGIFLILILI